MAKYTIDIPDEYEKCYAQSPSETLYIPMQVGTRDYNIWVGTGLSVTPYIEPDEDEIRQKVEHEVWEFVQGALIAQKTHPENIKACYNGKDLREVILDSSYSEVKAKYKTWKAERAKIRVGDEVIYHGNKYVVCYIEADEVYHIIDQNWTKKVVQGDYQIFKTGRNFSEMIY